IGGGGVPRTMIAGPPQQPGQYPQQYPQQPPQQQGGYQANSPQAKTMIAQQSPFAGGANPMQQQQAPQQNGLAPQGGNFVQSSPMQKTIVAGMAPPIMGGQMMQQQPHGMPPQGTPAGFPNQGSQGPNKTVLLQPTDGIVSVAQQQGRGPAGMPMPGMPGGQVQGATTLFWIVSLVIGIAVGVLGYVIVLQV
ncbi:MAG: hypothetical protein ABI678_30355, partial [Kofleriaceae bacterium]